MVGERVPARGYTVEIVTPSGETLRPRLLERTDWQPTVNGRPAFEAVTPYSEQKFERFNELLGEDLDIEARAWKDGVRLPIDRLEDVAPNRRAGTLTLVCSGGRQLERFRSIQIDEAESDGAFRDFVEENTDYSTDVDVAETTIRERVRQFQALNNETWRELLANELDGDAFPDDVPLRIQNGELQLLRTTHFEEAENGDYQGSITFQDNRYSGGRAVELSSSGDYVEIDPSMFHQYTVPAGNFAFDMLWAIDAPLDHDVQIEAEIQSSEDTVPLSFFAGGSGDQFTTSWSLSEPINNSGPASGSMDARFVLNSAPYDLDAEEAVSIYVDALILEDFRYNTGRDNDPDDEGRLSLPRSAPSIDVETVDFGTIERIIAGELTTLANGTSSETGLALSNDGGDSWPIEATDTESIEGDFPESSNQLRARFTLGTYEGEGTPTSSPLLGRERQAIDIATLYADLEDVPVILSELYEGRVEETLTTIASDADMNWELRRDPTADPTDRDGMVVAATQTGQRERESRARLVDVSGRRTISDSFDRVIVEGRSNSVEEAEFLGINSGEGVALGEENIVNGSETITSTDGETAFEFGVDYELEYTEGLLTVLEGGSMIDEPFLASFDWKPRGQFPTESDLEEAGIDNPRTLKEQAPSAATDRQCGQLALLTYRQVSEPLEEAEITLTAEAPDASLIAALNHPDVPFDAVQISDGDHEPGEIRLSAESRQSVSQIWSRLESRLNDVAKQL